MSGHRPPGDTDRQLYTQECHNRLPISQVTKMLACSLPCVDVDGIGELVCCVCMCLCVYMYMLGCSCCANDDPMRMMAGKVGAEFYLIRFLQSMDHLIRLDYGNLPELQPLTRGHLPTPDSGPWTQLLSG